MTKIQLITHKKAEKIKFFECLGKPKKAKLVYNIILIMTEMMSAESSPFWNDAHKYAFTTGEERFVSEIAYIMTTLHEEGFEN